MDEGADCQFESDLTLVSSEFAINGFNIGIFFMRSWPDIRFSISIKSSSYIAWLATPQRERGPKCPHPTAGSAIE